MSKRKELEPAKHNKGDIVLVEAKIDSVWNNRKSYPLIYTINTDRNLFPDNRYSACSEQAVVANLSDTSKVYGMLIVATADSSSRKPIVHTFYTMGDCGWVCEAQCGDLYDYLKELVSGDYECRDIEWVNLGPYLHNVVPHFTFQGREILCDPYGDGEIKDRIRIEE